VKGKLANGVGTLHTTSERVVSITKNFFLRITHKSNTNIFHLVVQ